LRCWREWVAGGVTRASEEEWQDVDFYAVRIEEWAEFLNVREAEPGVG